MKLIKAVAFLLQFGLVGLAIAVVYVIGVSDRSKHEIVDFLTANGTRPSLSTGGTTPVFSYADAVASSAASVVTIYTSKTVAQKPHPLLDDPTFRQLFGDQLTQQPQDRNQTSLGSGVIIGNEGYILTNLHVIDGADEILIALPDGRGSQAAVIGTDRDTDIAILQIPLNGISGINIAEPYPLRVGDVVLAIGNPLNVGQTVTMGIISATGRDRIGLNTFEDFIQTDAAINVGNSGGALINARGELIGINSAIFSQTGGSQGIGFAIPISLALNVMRQIIERGEVSRGWIGVVVSRISASAAMATENPAITGSLVADVFMDSPAHKAGIRPGDIVTAIDNSPVRDTRDLLDQITRYPPGSRVQVTVYRGPKQLTLEMQVIQRPQL